MLDDVMHGDDEAEPVVASAKSVSKSVPGSLVGT
jgi:hypothetical protein